MKTERTTWTVAPDYVSQDLMAKAIVEKVGKRNSRNRKSIRGLRTRFINDALRSHFARLAGKRDLR